MRRMAIFLIMVLLCLVTIPSGAQKLQVEVDAREISRGLLLAKITFVPSSDQPAIWYPKWIPGIHGPRGPIENLAGIKVFTETGEKVKWRRDIANPFKAHCFPPENTQKLVVHLRYICNQPTVNSKGVDSYGNPFLGVINWNTCVIYQDGMDKDKTKVHASLLLPENWKYATALAPYQEQNNQVAFQPVTLREFIDSPLICGEHMRKIDISTNDFPPHYLHLVSESSEALKLPEDVIQKYKNLVAEAKQLFQVAHFPSYHFLLVMSDNVNYTGLEHRQSSLNVVNERDLFDSWKMKAWVGNLLPHEYVHAWCGKHLRPQGMITSNYHEVKDTSLLWVYEGLTQYLGEILGVRSGFMNKEEYLERLAHKIAALKNHKGRQWRSLEDTAICSHHLRGSSDTWGNWRRSQDYYHEGLLWWLEIDARIRKLSNGKKSLDNFCQTFFAPKNPVPVGFDLREILETLSQFASYDWAKLIKERIQTPSEHLELTLVSLLNHQLVYSPDPTTYKQQLQAKYSYLDMSHSLGLKVNSEGKVKEIVPGMPADQAGVSYDMKIIGVNQRKFSLTRLKDSLVESTLKRKIELLVFQGDLYRFVEIAYAQGTKYLHIVAQQGKEDVLAEIVAAKREQKK